MRVSKIVITLALFGPSAGCYHMGELGNLGFELEIADTLYDFQSGDRVLVGSRICPGIGLGIVDGDPYLLGEPDLVCFAESVTGPAQFDAARCWSLDTPGEVVWELTPGDGCFPNYPEFLGDRIRVDVAGPTGQPRLGFDDWRVRVPMVNSVFAGDGIPQMVIGLDPGRALADLREDPNAPRRVVAGQLDAPMLRLDDELGRLYFADADLVLAFVGAGATAVEPAPPSEPEGYVTEIRLAGERPLELAPDAIVRIEASLPGGLVLESPELIAVPSSAAASLDLVVMVGDDGATPYQAYAEVRDGQDRVLHAAPIEWGVSEGALRVYPGDLGQSGRTGEFAEIGSGCEPPSASDPIERHAVLRARLGGLEDTVALTWIEPPEEPDVLDDPFVPDQACMFGDDGTGDGDDEVGDDPGGDDPGVDEGGCACSTERSTGPMSLTWLGLAGLLFVRRRRD